MSQVSSSPPEFRHHHFSRLGRPFGKVVVAAIAVLGTIGGSALIAAAPAGAVGTTLFIATTGSNAGPNNCQIQATPCATLAYALTVAAPDDTIMIAPGTYTMTAGSSNTVGATLTGLTIESSGTAANTIINAAGAINGLVVNADGVTVNGITVENAGAAGIQVSPPSTATPPASVTGETIENDVVTDSDQCQAAPSTSGCPADGGPSGDYGESLWLMSVTNSTLEGTTINNGLDGGLLVSDELGPNHGNTIEHNTVTDNALGCGITLASHSFAGVYDNTVEDNISNGAGANGIGLFNLAYDNTIEGNSLSDNGGPGIEVDDDVPGADLNGNTITGNTVGVNSLLGGPGGDSPGQHTVHTTQTGGILVIANVTPVTGTTISNNTISGNYFGVWMSHMASTTTLTSNTITVTPGGVPVYIAPAPGGGTWALGSDGGIFSFGQAPFWGSTGGTRLNAPIVGMSSIPDSSGYWLAAKDGGVFAFGAANFYGSMGGHPLNAPVVGIASTPDGGGYWLVASDGGIFSFGDATFSGSAGSLKLNQPIVGMTATADGKGYWLVASDGGVFTYGDAKFFGSAGGMKLNEPVVGMAATPDGKGYWLVASDGGVFSYGDAKFFGSMGGTKLNQPIVGMDATPDGGGYWLIAKDGGVFAFPDAVYQGSVPGVGIHITNIVGMESTP
jgi:parallel beta-helix repeat protein